MFNKLYSFIVIYHYCKIKLFYTYKEKKGIQYAMFGDLPIIESINI